MINRNSTRLGAARMPSPMHRTWIARLGLISALGCGSSGASNSDSKGPEAPIVQDAAPVTPADDAKATSNPEPLPAPPIEIPNGRLHDGYVVGGLPSKAQFDAAVEQGFDSALSLMANEEEGIREIAPYASHLGVRYIRFTVRGTEDLTESMAWQFASTLGMLGKPAIIHSKNGERVGAMFALMAFFVDEASAEDAMAIGEAAGMGSLAATIRPLLTHE